MFPLISLLCFVLADRVAFFLTSMVSGSHHTKVQTWVRDHPDAGKTQKMMVFILTKYPFNLINVVCYA